MLIPQHALFTKDCPLGHAQRASLPLDYERLSPYLLNPSYARLTEENLLARCLRHATQNANESFHHVIWSRSVMFL